MNLYLNCTYGTFLDNLITDQLYSPLAVQQKTGGTSIGPNSWRTYRDV